MRHLSLRSSARGIVAVTLLCLMALPAAAPTRVAARAATAPELLFPGPAHGIADMQTPPASSWVNGCNSHLNTDDGRVGGTTIKAGTAIEAGTECGHSTLALHVSGHGQFHATFGVAADDTTGKPGVVHVLVSDHDGLIIRGAVVKVSAASGPHTFSLDVTNGVEITLDFVAAPKTYLYGVSLSGAAWAYRAAPGDAGALPAGATAVNLAGVATTCNAHGVGDAGTVITVTAAGIPATKALTASGCGEATLIRPGAAGTLVLRYGIGDTAASVGLSVLHVRVLAADGHLLRKVIGVSAPGDGLRPLWVDLHGAGSVVLGVDGPSGNLVAITAVGVLPSQLALYQNPTRRALAGDLINPAALISHCNVGVGGEDTSVAQQVVFYGTFIVAEMGCGGTGLVLSPNAHGRFQALFGIPDTASPGSHPTVKVVALDRSEHPVAQATIHASYGAPAVAIDISVEHASTLSFSFSGGKAILYAMHLTSAASYDRIYPAVEPPVTGLGGLAINPSLFTVHCNAALADKDVMLVGDASLEAWALSGQECGEADLTLSSLGAARHMFSARIGIAAGEPPDSILKMQLLVLNSAGTVIRHTTETARYGYGPQPVQISLAGGAVLQIIWTGANSPKVVVYAMTVH